MSVHSTQKARRSSPITSFKQGPIRAILPVSSLMRQGCTLKKSKSNSPILSPTFSLKARFSPENSLSGQRSPGSAVSNRGKHSAQSSKSCIRRTASLDAIYLMGQWPKENAFYLNYNVLQVDKATQTDEWLSDRKQTRHSESISEDAKLEKYIRHKLQRVSKDTQNIQKLGLRLVSPPIQGDHNICGSLTPPNSKTPPNSVKSGPQSPMQSVPLNITMKSSITRQPMRNSVEGLNQEIERLVLKDYDDRLINCNSIPEGHRAPLADLLRQTRSVNTQTPGGVDDVDVEVDGSSSGPPSRDSVSPMVCGNIDISTPPNFIHGSRGSSPDEFARFSTSPHINKFLAREPPDGCEKVSLKLDETSKCEFGFTPLKPTTVIQFKPSLGSAFHPLQSNQLSLQQPIRVVPVVNGECTPDEKQGTGGLVHSSGGSSEPTPSPTLGHNNIEE